MLATLCSNPEAMKASRHQKITMHFAESELTRADIQIARHTSQLHRIARAKRANAESFILRLATCISNVSGAARIPPPPPAANKTTRRLAQRGELLFRYLREPLDRVGVHIGSITARKSGVGAFCSKWHAKLPHCGTSVLFPVLMHYCRASIGICTDYRQKFIEVSPLSVRRVASLGAAPTASTAQPRNP